MPKGKIFTPIMPLCIKGKFYAKAVVVYITTAFYAGMQQVNLSCSEDQLGSRLK